MNEAEREAYSIMLHPTPLSTVLESVDLDESTALPISALYSNPSTFMAQLWQAFDELSRIPMKRKRNRNGRRQ